MNASLTAYRQHLHDEIATIFPPPTFLGTTINLDSESRRQGIEAGFGWKLGEQVRLGAAYAYLDATEPDTSSGAQVREHRRPRHSGSVTIDGESGRFAYGASIAYVGHHFDSRDTFPFDAVPLSAYWLVDTRLGYSVRPGIELYARVANALNEKYQDVFSYRTEPRAFYAGVRLSR